MRLANIRAGLAYPHDGVCAFLSTHAHSYKMGYFRIDAMPYDAVLHLLKGGNVEIIDGTQHDKPLSDALKYGVTTWALVFNRALRYSGQVAPWETPEMRRAARAKRHKPLVQMIRKLADLVGRHPIIIGQNLHLTCHRQIAHDDRVDILRGLMKSEESSKQSVICRKMSNYWA